MAQTVHTLTHQAIHTKGEIDYSKTFEVLQRANNNPAVRHIVFESVDHYLAKGRRKEKINTIIFLDVLFKNANKALLREMQESEDIRKLGNDTILNDYFVHYILTKHAPEWAEACSTAGVLSKSFLDWVNSVTSYVYKYTLTPEICEKFKKDFATSIQLLSMFAQILVGDLRNKISADDDPTLLEIMPNILEIHRRLEELEPTVADESLLQVIKYIESFCDACKDSFASFVSSKTFSVEPLQVLMLQRPDWALQNDDTNQTPQKQTNGDLLNINQTSNNNVNSTNTDENQQRNELLDIVIPTPSANPQNQPKDDLIDFK